MHEERELFVQDCHDLCISQNTIPFESYEEPAWNLFLLALLACHPEIL